MNKHEEKRKYLVECTLRTDRNAAKLITQNMPANNQHTTNKSPRNVYKLVKADSY